MVQKKAYTTNNELKGLARTMLFLSSYMPLFAILSVRQFLSNTDKLVWGGFSYEAFLNFANYYGFSIFLALLCVIGIWGTKILFDNLEKRVENGMTVKVEEITSLNNEPLAYVATYIIPFMLENDYTMTNIITLILIFIVVYYLYINSKLILVNPFLSIKYSIYSIKYDDGGIARQGILITKGNNLQEADYAKIYNVGYQLFYGYKRETEWS